jgi:hypothetical protein
MLTLCTNVSYVVRHEQASSFVSVYHVYSVSSNILLMWICEV